MLKKLRVKAEKGLHEAKKAIKKQKIAELQNVNAEKAMFDTEKAQSQFRKENMYGEKDDQETSMGKGMS